MQKELDEALRDIDATALGMVARNGRTPLAGFGPAELAAVAIKNELAYAHRLITVAVQGGWVTVDGKVEWNYQRNGAETAVRGLPWVKGITNDLHLEPRTEAADVVHRIEAAFRGRAQRGNDTRLRSWAL
jgi:osmotically-inducible protein OsmY